MSQSDLPRKVGYDEQYYSLEAKQIAEAYIYVYPMLENDKTMNGS